MLWHDVLPKSMEDVYGIDHGCKLACKTEDISAVYGDRIDRSGVGSRFIDDEGLAMGVAEVKVANGAAHVAEDGLGNGSHNTFPYNELMVMWLPNIYEKRCKSYLVSRSEPNLKLSSSRTQADLKPNSSRTEAKVKPTIGWL